MNGTALVKLHFLGLKKYFYGLTTIDRIFIALITLIATFKMCIAAQGSPWGPPYPDMWSYLCYALYFAGFPINYHSEMQAWKPPLVPLLMSFFVRLGLDMQAIFMLMASFNLILGIFTYLLAAKMFCKEAGLYSSLLVLLNWHLWWYSGMILVDVPCIALLMASLYFYFVGLEHDTRYLWFLGLFAGLAVITKYTAFAVLGIYATYPFLSRRLGVFKDKNTYLAIMLLLATIGIWFKWNYDQFGSAIAPIQTYISHTPSLSESYLASIMYQLKYIRYVAGGEPVVLLSLLCLYSWIFKKNYVKQMSLLILWFTVFFVQFTYLKLLDERFMTIYSPIILIIAGTGLYQLRRGLVRNFDLSIGPRKINVKAISFGIILAITFAQVYNANPIFSMKRPYINDYFPTHSRILWVYSGQKDEELIKLCAYVHQHAQKNDALVVHIPSYGWLDILVTSYYTRIQVMRYQPNLLTDDKTRFVIIEAGHLNDLKDNLVEYGFIELITTNKYLLYNKASST